MARIIPAFTQFFDDEGDPLVEGFLKFVESGTNNTDKDTFSDISENIANTNPVKLDGAGRCPNIFGTGSYNVISYTNVSGSPGVQIQQFDPVSGDAFQGALSDWNSATIYSDGNLVTGSDDKYYRSLISNNQNQDPTTSPGQWEEVRFLGVWNSSITYASGDLVSGSDNLLYISRTSANLNNDPTADSVNWRLLNDTPDLLNNVGFTATVASKALTFALKTNDLTDPTAIDKVIIAFRDETLTNGNYDIVSAIAATSIIAPDGATLGFGAAETDFIYLYAINNAGTIEAAVIGSLLDEAVLHTTVAIDATADADNVLYSTTLRSDVPIRLVGRIKIETGAVAGEWDNAPTELYVGDTKPSLFGGEYIKLADVKANTTDGGTFTSGSWQTRTLNTEDSDTGNHCSLSSNQFTLDAGTYRVLASAPAFKVDRHKTRLRNTTDSSDTIIGTNENNAAASNTSTYSFVKGLFTITASKTFELQHQCQTTRATDGYGIAASYNVSEIYSIVELWKVK